MSDPIGLALTILVLPLAAAVMAWLAAGNATLKKYAHVPLILACGTAAILALLMLTKMLDGSASIPLAIVRAARGFSPTHQTRSLSITSR